MISIQLICIPLCPKTDIPSNCQRALIVMKLFVLISCLILCLSDIFSQTSTFELERYQTNYEREILSKKDATHLERLMALAPNASPEKTLAVKKQIDSFIEEIKASNLLRLSEAKLMNELHKRVHKRFLTHYQYISPFHEIFKTGQYNCVSATALFALVLEELKIPYNIQEQPTHVYILAYPNTKAISVEMTAIKNVLYIPVRKDISRAVQTLIELGLTTTEKVRALGEQKVYDAFYNRNDVIDLTELAGIQYFNDAITAFNENKLEDAFQAILKTERWYDREKVSLFKRELLETLLSEANIKSMKDIGYLTMYSNLKNADQTEVYYLFAEFLQEQLLLKSNKTLADSSHVYITQNIKDTNLLSRLNGLYYYVISGFYNNSYNLTKRLEFAELSYKTSPENQDSQMWFVKSIIVSFENYKPINIISKMDAYVEKYPFLKTHNLFLSVYFYTYLELSNDYYKENNGDKGKIYFDLALKTRDLMEDKEVLDPNQVGWLYAEAGSYFYRQSNYKAALKVLEEGLLLAPDHERIVERIRIVKLRMK